MARPNSCNGGRKKADRTDVVRWFKDRVSKSTVAADARVVKQEFDELSRENPGFNEKAWRIARKLTPEIVSIPRHGFWWLMDTTISPPQTIPAAGAPRTAMVEAARQIILEDREKAARQEMFDCLTDIAKGDGIDAFKGIPEATPERCLQTMEQQVDGNDKDYKDYGITREQLVQIEKQHGPTVKIAERAARLAAKKQQQEAVERVQVHRQNMTEIAKEFAAKGATPEDCLKALKDYAAKQDAPPSPELIEATAYLHGPKG